MTCRTQINRGAPSLNTSDSPQKVACTLCDGNGHRCDYCDGNGFVLAEDMPEHASTINLEMFDAR